MAELEEILVRIEGDVRGLRRALDQAERKTSSSTRKMERSFGRLDGAMKGIAARAARLGPLLAAAFGTAAVVGAVRLQDNYRLLEGRMRLVTDSAEELNGVIDQLSASSIRNGTSLEAALTIYQRIGLATRNLGMESRELVKITEGLQQAFVVSGASAQEARNALIQLSQGLSSGQLRGEEFRSVAEQGTRILQALETQLGKTRGELIEMAFAGEITTEVFLEAFAKELPTIMKEFENMPDTVGRAIERIRASLLLLVGRNEEASEAQEKLITALNNLAEFLGSDEAANLFSGIISGLNSVIEAAASGVEWLGKLDAAIKALTGGEDSDTSLGLGSNIFDLSASVARNLGLPELRVGGTGQPFGDREPDFRGSILNLDDLQGGQPGAAPRGRRAMSAAAQRNQEIFARRPGVKPAPTEEDLKALDQAAEKARLAREAAVDAINQLVGGLEQEAQFVGMSNEEREVQIALLEAERIAREGGLNGISAQTEARIRAAVQLRAEKEAQVELQEALERGQEQTDRILQTYQTRIDTLGMTTAEQIRYNAEQQIANLLQDENTEITQAQIAAIREKAGALADATAAQEKADEAAQKAKDAQEEAARQAQELGDVFATAFEDAIVNGEDLGDVLNALEQDILRILTRILITKPLQDTLGGMFGGPQPQNGGIFGPIGGIFGNIFGGGMSGGTPPISPGMPGAGGPGGIATGGGGGIFGALFSGLGSLFGGLFESGGTVGMGGRPRKAMNPAAFSGAPSAAVGGMLPDSGAIPIMAHRGERILNRAETEDYNRGVGRGNGRGGGAGVTQVFNVQTTGDRIRDAENAQQTAIRAREQMQRVGRNF